jgi:hypothetical protein
MGSSGLVELLVCGWKEETVDSAVEGTEGWLLPVAVTLPPFLILW